MDKVLYIEPNFNEVAKSEIGTPYYVHDMEDYCIYVDLMVEAYDRTVNGKVKSGNNYFVFSWKTHKDGVTSASFLGGKKINLDKSNSFNILTTDYINTHYLDVVDDVNRGEMNNNELFGIESINITYNNMCAPQVTIKFTDIKGVSLFAPEELRHQKTYNGLGGLCDDDVSGSFFKCFFTLPYPTFTLKIKGFYGEPVGYELTCIKFNATFDSKTGNFGATAEFVAFAFSMLADVNMNALLASPYSDYIGKSYWQQQVDNGRFTVYDRDGNMNGMPTLAQVLKDFGDVNTNLSNPNNQNNEVNEQYTKANERVQQYSTMINGYKDDIFNTLYRNTNSKFGENNQRIYVDSGYTFLIALTTENETIFDEDFLVHVGHYNSIFSNITESEMESYKLVEGVNYYKINKFIVDGKISDVNKVLDDYPTIKQQLANFLSAKELNKEINSCCILKYPKYIDLQKKLEQESETFKKCSDIIRAEQTKAIEDAIGFRPSVYNVLKLILAHFETFMHMFFETNRAVDNINSGANPRTLNDFRCDKNDVGLDVNEKVPVWPQVLVLNSETSEKQDGWIGNLLVNGMAQPEAEMINGVIQGLSCVDDVVQEYRDGLVNLENVETTNEGNSYSIPSVTSVINSQITTPSCVMDIVTEGNPFLFDYDVASTTNNYHGILLPMYFRMYNSLVLDNKQKIDVKENAKTIGKIDAFNFYKKFGNKISEQSKQLFTAATIDEINTTMESRFDYWDKKGIPTLSTFKEYLSEEKNYLGSVDDINNESVCCPFKCFHNNYVTINPNKNSHEVNTTSNNDSKLPKTIYFYDNVRQFDSLASATQTDTYLNDLFSNAQYKPYKIYGNNQSFVQDLDGIGDEYYKKNYTLGVKWRFSEENDGNMVISTENPTSKNFGIISAEGKENGSFPVTSKCEDNVLACNGKAYIRPDFNFSKFVQNDLSTVTDFKNFAYTIPTIPFFDKDYSLFMSNEYYEAKSKIDRAWWLLDCLAACHDVRHMVTNFLSNEPFIFTTELCAIYAGALLTYNATHTTTSFLFFNSFESTRRGTKKELGETSFWDSSVTNSLNLYTNEWFMKRFINWLNDTSSTGFTGIENSFALHDSNGVLFTVDKLNEFKKAIKKSNDKTVYGLVDANFRKNYCKVNQDYMLFMREDSEAVESLMRLYIKPLLIVKPYNNSSDLSLFEDASKLFKRNVTDDYITGFQEKFIEMMSASESAEPTLDTSPTPSYSQVTPPTCDENVQIEIYKYCKVLHDKWLGAYSEEDIKLENYFDNYYHFIDCYYNDISNVAIINIKTIIDTFFESLNSKSMNLVSFISTILGANKMMFNMSFNFISLKGGDYQEKMKKMFKPIPYLEMAEAEVKPHYIILYNGETSAHLDINGSEYLNDSYMANEEMTWPEAIKNKGDEDYTLPAFGVSYGSQYQSYFTDISVGTTDSMATSEAYRIETNIAFANSPNGGNNGQVAYTLGQDMYSVHANRSYTCNVTMMGCAWVQPMMCFVLNNVPLFRGTYQIIKVQHSITPGNMTTTFTGVRMANKITPLVKDPNRTAGIGPYLGLPSNNDFIDTSKMANIDNDCKYNIYSVLNGKSNFDISILDEVGGVKKYGGVNDPRSKFGNSQFNQMTLLDGLTTTAIGEYGSSDELGVKLVITAMFNRIMARGGRDVSTVLNYSQFNGFKNGVTSGHDVNKVKGWVKEIFVNTPISLVGRTAIFNKNFTWNDGKSKDKGYIWNENTKSSELAHNVVITKEMVQKLKHFCGIQCYVEGDSHKGHHYLFRHGGHVYCCDKETPTKQPKLFWDVTELNSSDTKTVESDGYSKLAHSLINAIQQTIDTTDAIDCKISLTNFSGGYKNVAELANSSSNSEKIYVTANTESQLGQVFDIMLNGYGNYFDNLIWYCKNKNDIINANYPNCIIGYVVNGNANITKISVQNSFIGSYTSEPLSENTNQALLKILNKHYCDKSDNEKVKLIKTDCKQFNNISDDKLINLLNNAKVENCVNLIPNGNLQDNFEIPVNPPKNIGDIQNPLMRLVFTNIDKFCRGHNYNQPNKWYNVTPDSKHGLCTYGPATWYHYASKAYGKNMDLHFWNGSNPENATWKNTFMGGLESDGVTSKNYGFKLVWHGTPEQSKTEMKNYVKLGDIATMFVKYDPPKKKNDGTIQYSSSHACMYVGNGEWRSDFIQKNAWCYGKNPGRQGDYSVCLWRQPDFQ